VLLAAVSRTIIKSDLCSVVIAVVLPRIGANPTCRDKRPFPRSGACNAIKLLPDSIISLIECGPCIVGAVWRGCDWVATALILNRAGWASAPAASTSKPSCILKARFELACRPARPVGWREPRGMLVCRLHQPGCIGPAARGRVRPRTSICL